jgi:hypothetical protein
MKPLLVIVFALLCKLQVADYLQWIGKDLSKQNNLPHRSLGLTYAAYTLEPHRTDYIINYMSDYILASAQFQLIEGQVKPVVPLMAGRLAQENLEEDQLLKFSHMFAQWKMKQRENVKVTIIKEENGEKMTARIE